MDLKFGDVEWRTFASMMDSEESVTLNACRRLVAPRDAGRFEFGLAYGHGVVMARLLPRDQWTKDRRTA